MVATGGNRDFVILRIWRATVRPGAEADLLDRLRALMPRLEEAGAPLELTCGFRHVDATTTFLAISTWPDYAVIEAFTGSGPAEKTLGLGLDEVLEHPRAETYERLPPSSERLDVAEGRVLGVVTGTVLPQHESIVQSMIDRSAGAALQAGALAAHLGRRFDDGVTSVAIVVIWPKRDAMTRFVRSRAKPAIDPAFAEHLSSWRFETYFQLSPERLLVPTEGPAVLVIDGEGHYVDATAGIESVIGVPGELLYGHTVLDLAGDDRARSDLRRRLLETSVSHGTMDLLRPDGATVTVRYRSVAGVPGPGLRSAVFTRPGEPDDNRPTAAIVEEALGSEAAGIPSGQGAPAGSPA